VAAGLIALTEHVVPDLSAFADRLLTHDIDRQRVGRIIRSLAPYAASIGRAGDVTPYASHDAASGQPSFWKRLFG
jgi:hypothetical protein